MQAKSSYVMVLVVSLLLLAGCQLPANQTAAPAAGTSVAAETAAEATGEATEAAMEEAAAEATAEAMDHSSMDHGAMSSDEPFDAQFIDGMIVHHEGAITMAEQVLAESERPELRAMAEAIIEAQQLEVAKMKSWRVAWYSDLAETSGVDMDMGMMEIPDDAAKPFEQRFMETMIDHHQGAVEMAKMALESGEHPELLSMAEDVIATQEAEIAQMRAWLKDWYGVEYASE